MTARKGDRSAPLSASLPTAPAPREAKAVRNSTAPLDAPSGGLPPPTPPPAPRDRRGVPRPPRPALAPRLPLVAPDPPSLSALDRLLLRTHAAHQTNAPDAPDAAELQALVAEVVGLSVERPRSAYHLGLRAARDAAAAVPTRRQRSARDLVSRWTAGWLGAGRPVAEIARFYTDEPGAAGALLRHGEGLDTWAGAWLLAGLLAADVPALAADVLRHCPAIACLAARETLLDAADALLRGDRPAEASVVLDVLAALPPPGEAGPRAPHPHRSPRRWTTCPRSLPGSTG